MTEAIICTLVILSQLAASDSAATAPSHVPVTVFRSRIDQNAHLEVVITKRIPATRPTTVSTGTVLPDFIETYQVRRTGDTANDADVLHEFTQPWYSEFSSDRMRFRILSVALTDDYLFIVFKIALSTWVNVVRPADDSHPAVGVATKLLLRDNDEKGPIVVSADFRLGPTLSDSWLVLNKDFPSSRREIRLSDCLPDEDK